MKDKHIGVIGAGAMGGSFAAGLVRAGYSPSLITVTNPHEGRLACLKEIGINASTDNLDAVSGSDLIIVAVKPWIVPEVIRQIRPAIQKGQEVALIVAGISGADLSAMMESHGVIPPFSIVMPNTAMRLGESMTFLVPVHGECPLAGEAFGMLGKVMKIEERLLGAGTALASCGIAYAMRYVRAAVEGGVQLGFRAADAQAIVTETILGAAALLSQPGAHPESEIDKVTTPGGITIRGLNTMEQYGFSNAVIKGLTI